MPGLVQPLASRPVAPPRAVTRPSGGQQLLNQALFRDALVRQHRQSDRFEEPFGLVLVSLARLPGAASVWAQVIEALTASASPADFVGWFEEGLVLGMIRSRGDMDHLETGSTLQTTVERDLARRFPDA